VFATAVPNDPRRTLDGDESRAPGQIAAGPALGNRLDTPSEQTVQSRPIGTIPSDVRPDAPRHEDRIRPERMRWRAVRSAEIWLALVRPAVLAGLALVLVVQLLGMFSGADEALALQLRALDGVVGREHTPTVIAVDDAAIARLGPPPWDGPAWQRVVAALDRQALGDVVLADPWPRLLRTATPGGTAERARVLVPSSTWDGRPVPPIPTSTTPWLLPTDDTLAITLPTHGVLSEIAPGPTWLPCRDAACAGARLALQRADVPVVSLATVLDAAPGFVTSGSAGALLGVTASPWADTVRVGPEDVPVPWVLATARAVASARAGALLRPPSITGVAAWLTLIYLASGLATFRARPGRTVVVVLLLGLVAPLLVLRVLHVSVPVAASVILAAVPPVARAVAVGQGAVRGMRRLSLLVIRAASRAGTLRRRVESPDGLLDVLADLTRAHAADAPFAMLLLEQGARRLRFHGGYGLTSRDFTPEAFSTRQADVAAALVAWSGVEAARVLTSGRPARLVPLAQGGEVVALWVLALPESGGGPDPRRLARLARWVGERLALPGVAGAFSSSTELVPDTPDDESLENLFLAADEERRRWLTCVQRVGVPVLVADVGGNLTNLNPAMQDALESAGLPRPKSVRELVLRVDGERHLERWLDRLFGEGVTIAMPWPGEGDLHLCVRPVAGEAEAGTIDQPLLGYLGWLEPGAFEEVVTRKAADGDSTERYLPKFGFA
jgi:hypothetical protein